MRMCLLRRWRDTGLGGGCGRESFADVRGLLDARVKCAYGYRLNRTALKNSVEDMSLIVSGEYLLQKVVATSELDKCHKKSFKRV
jgi:hypothetical protein